MSFAALSGASALLRSARAFSLAASYSRMPATGGPPCLVCFAFNTLYFSIRRQISSRIRFFSWAAVALALEFAAGEAVSLALATGVASLAAAVVTRTATAALTVLAEALPPVAKPIADSGSTSFGRKAIILKSEGKERLWELLATGVARPVVEVPI